MAVNSERYVALLQDFFHLLLRKNDIDTENIWFQQDGATLHIANILMDILRSSFPGRLVSGNCEIS